MKFQSRWGRRMYARYAKLNCQKIGSIATFAVSYIPLVNTLGILLLRNKEYYLKSHKGELEGDMVKDKEIGEMPMPTEHF